MPFEYKLIPAFELNNILFRSSRFDAQIIILFGGDRITCCDEVFVALDGGELAGMVSIAPDGEEQRGQPTIVGLYCFPAFRRRGIATELFRRAIDRCKERGFVNVRIDVLSRNAMSMVNAHFSAEARHGYLDVHDFSKGPSLFDE